MRVIASTLTPLDAILGKPCSIVFRHAKVWESHLETVEKVLRSFAEDLEGTDAGLRAHEVGRSGNWWSGKRIHFEIWINGASPKAAERGANLLRQRLGFLE